LNEFSFLLKQWSTAEAKQATRGMENVNMFRHVLTCIDSVSDHC